MAKEKLPKLTEAQVRQLATAQSFERGKSYYHEGMISDQVCQGAELRARCQGSDDEPYEVSATLGKAGVEDYDCDCPYDYGGACKHVVALLLEYVHQPQSFASLTEVKGTLAECSKEELLALVGEMVKREPKLKSVIELAQAAPKAGKPLNVAAYRKQARRAMQSESPRTIEKELRALRGAADKLAKGGDWLNAGAIYHTALDEAVLGYDDMVHSMDEDGDICIELEELAKGLSKCLAKSQADAKTRWEWLETMLEAYLKDVEIGGIDLTPSAGEAVLKQANEEEWARIEERLRTEAAHSRDWARECLIGFLTEGLDKRKRGKEANELIRELGTPEQQAYLLLGEKKIAEALKLIKKIVPGKPGLVTQFADALVRAKAKQEAVALVMEHGGAEHRSTRDWLAKYYREHGTPQEAVEAQRKVMRSAPSVQAFKTLRDACKKTNDWEQVRKETLKELEQKEQIGMLIELALAEDDVERALVLLPRVKQVGWYGNDYKTQVAQAAQKEYPRAAAKLYQEMIERQIANKSRGAYQEAVRLLKTVRQLLTRLEAQAEWAAYMQKLRAKYPTLRALQEELNKAKL